MVLSEQELIEIHKATVEDYFTYNGDEIPISITEQVAISIFYLENKLENFRSYIRNIKVTRKKIHQSLIEKYRALSISTNPLFISL